MRSLRGTNVQNPRGVRRFSPRDCLSHLACGLRPYRAVLALLAALAAGCAATPQPQKSQLEVREFQTRTFDTPDVKLVMKAMLNVLQDDGYVVKNAVVDLGLITALRENDLAPGRSGSGGADIFDVLGHNGIVIFGSQSEPRFRKTEVIDFTGNVSEFGPQTKVRVSFQTKVLDNRGEVVEVHPIDDEKFYQDFFSRMDKGMFLQREQL